ncbi:MAG: class I SAM-dependent methyltransferase [Planctomycetales bacterium]|nr:class I SAM-dependent methyltransferase [Planctomycetales bacterium]
MSQNTITFSFGKNWKSFLDHMPEDAIAEARDAIADWLDADSIAGIDVLDIGCGSGLHSLCFHLLGAKTLHSFDYDEHSVQATERLWEKADKPNNWRVEHGSVLDKGHLAKIDPADLVYSWGVLHHTGSMWEAIGNAADKVRPGGRLFIALYVKGPNYAEHLALKQEYNSGSWMKKKWMIRKFILRRMLKRWRKGKNPFTWNEPRRRGMNVYHDLIDWYGGLPYEVASPSEVDDFLIPRGFQLQRIREVPEGGCNEYLYQLASHS